LSIYLTNKSFNVAHKDDVSHVSPLESSSSAFPNHPLVFVDEDDDEDVDPFFNRESFDDLSFDDDGVPRKNPSIALPIMRASTIALRPSHFKRFNGDLCSFRFLPLLALSFDDGESFDVDVAGALSVNLSNVSRANETVACADDLTVFVRFDAGMCRFVNHALAPAAEAAADDEDFVSSLNCCFTPFNMDTSKLFERFLFLRLVLRSGFKKLLAPVAFVAAAIAAADDVIGGCVCIGVGTSLIRFISVAEEANDESKEIRSVLVQMMPAFLDGLGVGARETLGDIMQGFSDARRFCGIGANVVCTKSEKRLFV
jgi:hypothetical protein